MLAAHLHYLLEAQPPADLGRLVEHLPREWIEQALQETDKVSLRRWRLPAEPVVWLVIGLGAVPTPVDFRSGRRSGPGIVAEGHAVRE